MQNIPPGTEHLFDRQDLLPVIQSLGSTQMWLDTPNYLKESKASTSGSKPTCQSQYYKGDNKEESNSRRVNYSQQEHSPILIRRCSPFIASMFVRLPKGPSHQKNYSQFRGG